MKHIVMYSGGIGSWATAKRVIQEYGASDIILLFTDTLIEDEDLYRFLDETTREMGVEFVRIADGRTPWEVYHDRRFLGNSRRAPCSHVLKQEMSRKWVEENFSPDECTIYLGIDWTEMHRTIAPIENWKPYTIKFPMTEEPFLDKEQMLQSLEALGIKRPRLYEMGFTHNNCGGFCCRAGQGHFANLLMKMPDRFAECESNEEAIRQHLGKDVTILRKQRNGIKTPYSLRELREDIEKKREIDMTDIGGCGCFLNYDEEAV
ncbi:hypothetical protein C0R09_18740 [Brevibacillus laterosporus]|uniref:hypothetical protein n=1 Tax=Brevibacillus laterosporus TaxID=1465 RepID=UPI000C76EC6F|nr:hypothetical protein [Brevibacillus laterosporus]AUM66392.1 hypothetical protein C0R09_18740 [Brevibacillus laterosporus]